MLYKYRKLYTRKKNGHIEFNENTMSILCKNEIYIPSHEELNDPWEKIIKTPPYESYNDDEKAALLEIDREASDLGLAEFKTFGKDILDIQKDLDSSINDLNTLIFEENNWGIFSMSSINDSILMWSHYGDEHRGICLGFDKQAFFNTGNVIEVKYRKKIPSIDPKKVYSNPERYYFRNKYYGWAYEKEWRYLHMETSVVITSPAPINSIFLGARVEDEVIDIICDKFSNKFSIFKANIEKNNYKIIFNKLT